MVVAGAASPEGSVLRHRSQSRTLPARGPAAPGDRVVGPAAPWCVACAMCRRGQIQLGQRGGVFGSGPTFGGLGGAMAEFLRVPHADTVLSKIPDGVIAVDRVPGRLRVAEQLGATRTIVACRGIRRSGGLNNGLERIRSSARFGARNPARLRPRSGGGVRDGRCAPAPQRPRKQRPPRPAIVSRAQSAPSVEELRPPDGYWLRRS
ncbi:alcohol dehydrogenase catalytic domain-containing protein [Agromyces bauzanensis]|uniref:alcohol dehydrogenase catalytic domain-containing protein n=1 Tax=Agromyces bauzanensis TaxID=1308924 RepID=UPI0031EB49D5